MPKPYQKIMQYVGQHGMVRPRDIEAIGLPREYLVRLHRQGKVNRSGRGIYTLPDAAVTERHSYAEVAKRVPEAVILPALGAYLSRNHYPEPAFRLDCSR
jgi:predicted transcriptional regulator of viral defense system